MFTWVRSFDPGDNLFGSEDFLGWDFSFTGNITKHFALEADVSGSYWLAPSNIIGTHYHTIAGGPRFTFPSERVTPYIHFLVGMARGTGGVGDLTVSMNSLLLAAGFGMDVAINDRFAVRAFQVDWVALRSGEWANNEWVLTNIRIGGGFVVKF
jgi:hypothetical protein